MGVVGIDQTDHEACRKILFRVLVTGDTRGRLLNLAESGSPYLQASVEVLSDETDLDNSG